MYSYSNELYSDLFKDVNGFRPRGLLMESWNSKSPSEKQKEWDMLCDSLNSEDHYGDWEPDDRQFCYFHKTNDCNCFK